MFPYPLAHWDARNPFYKNIERHTTHTIVSWPNPKQWIIVHTSNLMMMIIQSMHILSIITKEMGKLKTHSPTYCIMDNWENMLNLTHTLDKLYLTGILYVQCLQIKFAQWWWWDGVMYKQTNTICKPKRIRLFALIINCTILMKTNSRFSRNVYTISDTIWCNKHLRHATTEKYENNGKGGYFRFDDDNNMSYRYILSITYM